MTKPGGSPVADHVKDGVPPCACTVTPGYAAFTTPLGAPVVLMISVAAMTMG